MSKRPVSFLKFRESQNPWTSLRWRQRIPISLVLFFLFFSSSKGNKRDLKTVRKKTRNLVFYSTSRRQVWTTNESTKFDENSDLVHYRLPLFYPVSDDRTTIKFGTRERATRVIVNESLKGLSTRYVR